MTVDGPSQEDSSATTQGPVCCRQRSGALLRASSPMGRAIHASGPDGQSVIEHLAGVEDFQVAMATYRAACERWPGTVITLRQGAQVIESPIRLRQEA